MQLRGSEATRATCNGAADTAFRSRSKAPAKRRCSHCEKSPAIFPKRRRENRQSRAALWGESASGGGEAAAGGAHCETHRGVLSHLQSSIATGRPAQPSLPEATSTKLADPVLAVVISVLVTLVLLSVFYVWYCALVKNEPPPALYENLLIHLLPRPTAVWAEAILLKSVPFKLASEPQSIQLLTFKLARDTPEITGPQSGKLLGSVDEFEIRVAVKWRAGSSASGNASKKEEAYWFSDRHEWKKRKLETMGSTVTGNDCDLRSSRGLDKVRRNMRRGGLWRRKRVLAGGIRQSIAGADVAGNDAVSIHQLPPTLQGDLCSLTAPPPAPPV
ncbi:unnamed protein product, partial [Iphiclides podalirius]